jgi:multidrug efflux system membrane fusion protein
MTESIRPLETSPARPRRRKRWIFGLGFILVLAIVALVVRRRTAQKSSASAASSTERSVPVLVAPVLRQDVPIYLEGLGNATPLQTVTMRSQVDGRLNKVLFREGQAVHKGDLLAQVDPRPFLILLHQGEAALARDEAQRKNAALNLERYRALLARNLVSQQQVDDQQAVTDQSEAATKADRAQIENARLQLDYARIVSPIDGVTGVRQVDQGNVVHASDPAGIVVITQLDPISVTFTLPQDDLPKVAKELARTEIPLDALSRDGSTRLASGKLQVIDNQISASTATAKLKGVFPNPDGALWPNQFVKVRLLVTTRQGATVLPAAAIQRGPQGTFVYVVTPDDTAALRPVEVETTMGETAIIARGVAVGERVVSDGQNQLRPGSKVAPRSGGGAPPGASSTGGPRP